MNEMFIFELEPFRVRRQRRRALQRLSIQTEVGGAAPPAGAARTSRSYVAWLQSSLNRALGTGLAVDGILGPATRSAIRTFQQREGLQVDGIVGPLTEQRLIAVAGGGAPSPSGGGVTTSTKPPGTPAATDWTAVPGAQRMARVMTLLAQQYGYPVNGAAGVVGNLWAESSVLPNRIEGSSAETPMRARNFANVVTDFTAEQVMNRNAAARRGPRLPGIGIAQWTFPPRRLGLFRHSFKGRVLGPAILDNLDAQVDYLVSELSSIFGNVDRFLRNPGVSLEAASDEVVYSFEVPGTILTPAGEGPRRRLPRDHPSVQAVFQQRRGASRRALQAYQGADEEAYGPDWAGEAETSSELESAADETFYIEPGEPGAAGRPGLRRGLEPATW